MGCSMKAGPVPNEYGVLVLVECVGELPEEDVDHIGVESRTEQPFGLSGLWADRAENPQIIVLCLAHRSRA